MIWAFEGDHTTSSQKTAGREEVVYLGGRGVKETQPELLLPRENMQLGGRPWPGGHPEWGNQSGLPHLCSVKKTELRKASPSPVE